MQHAHAFEVVQDGRIYIEKINGPFLYVDRGTPEEYAAGLGSRSNAAGSNCMTAAPSSASRNPARTCSPDVGELRESHTAARRWPPRSRAEETGRLARPVPKRLRNRRLLQ